MTSAEQREAARQFINRWRDRGNEDEDGRSYWIEFLHDVLGMDNVTERVDFEKKVYVDGNKKRIDAYIPETHVLIEQKSLGKALDQKIHNSGGIDLTPYEQAKRYADNLDYDEKVRWIVTSNFSEIWIYNMNEANKKDVEPTKINLIELQDKFPLLDFMMKEEVKEVSHEVKVSIEAGNIVGKLYEAFLSQYKDPEDKNSLRSLNMLCVRLVFCLYAEDAGIFGERNMFHDYLEPFDAKYMRTALMDLFHVLDQKPEERDPYLVPELAAFPYVNGGLFREENIEIPMFTEEIRSLLLKDASENFDWSSISPTIFGAVFESTLNPETRRSGGMHYTSVENIHKLIDELFLNDLTEEFHKIQLINVVKTKKQLLDDYQTKLASLHFLDPAAGSGNFLTETYLSLRRLENEVIKEKIALQKGVSRGQIIMGEAINPIKVSITQFYGIEINDFAVSVAKTALWIAESQMMKETEDIVHMSFDFLPLTTNASIIEANALRIDWNDIVPAGKLDYIMGNPPFVGYKLQSDDQKEDLRPLFKSTKNIDYVAGWYKKAAMYIQNTKTKVAFVSTNSIVQGEQVAPIWKPLFRDYHITINFAYRTFIWDSEATDKAHVHCVIIGFSAGNTIGKQKTIYDKGSIIKTLHINAYLVSAPNIFIEKRAKPICNEEPMIYGNEPREGGYLILSDKEAHELINETPAMSQYIKRFVSSNDFINNKTRYCLWLVQADANVIRKSKIVMDRLKNCRSFRLKSKQKQAHAAADTPALFASIRQPVTDYLLIPVVSSQNRQYIPIGYMSKDVILSNACFSITNASLYTFGVITSNVHMAWVRATCGRLKSDYRYSNSIVYNNFPWPSPTDAQRAKIEQTAQKILDVRALYPDSSLADLYDPLTMPPELRKAHQNNDRAVMAAYGFSTKISEADCVAELMKMYQKLIEEVK
jgi:type I restriction-modification system DNA methylase subunit